MEAGDGLGDFNMEFKFRCRPNEIISSSSSSSSLLLLLLLLVGMGIIPGGGGGAALLLRRGDPPPTPTLLLILLFQSLIFLFAKIMSTVLMPLQMYDHDDICKLSDAIKCSLMGFAMHEEKA